MMMQPTGLAPDLADALLRRQLAGITARADSLRAERRARPAPRPAPAARRPAPRTRPAPPAETQAQREARAAASWSAIVANFNSTARRRGPGVVNAC